MIKLTILGSTGSIGRNTLSIVQKNPKLFKVVALAANKNISVMLKQCLEFKPEYVAMHDKKSAIKLIRILNQYSCNTKVLSGANGVYEIADLDDIDQVMSAITGIAGLIPTLIAVTKGKRILLANKETLIVCGQLFFNAIKKYNTQVLPVDSEHNAIFQILSTDAQNNLGFLKLQDYAIKKIILTGSGGPVRHIPLYYLKNITPNEACKHPNWHMGRKISVDSATMMNKGFEYIEAKYFFNASSKEIDIIIHPESIIHSMVYYIDGSINAQLGIPDMTIPISYCMSYPNRINSDLPFCDFNKLSSLTFAKPDYKRYPCLQLAINICYNGQTPTIILNASNEIAVDEFLKGNLKFTDIAKVNYNMVEKLTFHEPKNINEILDIDNEVRILTTNYVKNLTKLY
uniref:1-deoxy-D-xylulose 5-phosphate reductoisomerase n=1 Tax=Candidatus Aschnera chinzeii TaxID=1485666 RepID=A0AAT9G3Y9_9ENTR|nr:MAG: 1-deoxy-D-xylulose-5-phosphate reductoisomerase [Candidatus Aschnera chinzeii]